MSSQSIKVSVLQKICDPYKDCPWHCGSITTARIKVCVQGSKFALKPLNPFNHNRSQHIKRIAYLVKNGWSDPIQIDVGVPSLGCNIEWPVVDGNHRLAAAIFRGDEEILCEISGSMDYAEELLGVSI
jgi:hypothetical protein